MGKTVVSAVRRDEKSFAPPIVLSGVCTEAYVPTELFPRNRLMRFSRPQHSNRWQSAAFSVAMGAPSTMATAATPSQYLSTSWGIGAKDFSSLRISRWIIAVQRRGLRHPTFTSCSCRARSSLRKRGEVCSRPRVSNTLLATGGRVVEQADSAASR